MERTNARTLTRRPACPSRSASPPSTCRSSRSPSSSARSPRRSGRAATSSRWSSRSSRPVGAGPTTASSATRRSIARSSSGPSIPRARWAWARARSSPRRSPGRPATASSWSISRAGPAAPRSASGSPRSPAMTVARIGFAYNPTIEASVELSARAAGWCQMRGIGEWQLPSGDTAALVRELPTTDILVVLGGDGTFLRAAMAVTEVDVPLIGINLGKVGFLSKAEAGDMEDVLTSIVDGGFGIEERLAIEGRILRGGARRRRTSGRAQRHRHRAGLAGPRLPARCRDRRYPSRDVHRRRPRRCQPDRLDRLLVLGRRPDPRSRQSQSHRHPDRGLPVGHPIGRGRPQPGRALHGRRCLRGARLRGRARGPAARGRGYRRGPRAGPADPPRVQRGAQPFWDLLRHKVALLPS